MQHGMKTLLYYHDKNCKWSSCDTFELSNCQERVRVKRQKWMRASRFGSASKNSRRATGGPAALHSFFAHPAIPPSAPCPSAAAAHHTVPYHIKSDTRLHITTLRSCTLRQLAAASFSSPQHLRTAFESPISKTTAIARRQSIARATIENSCPRDVLASRSQR